MDLVHGAIYECEGHIYKAFISENSTTLIRVDEESGEKIPEVPLGGRLGFVWMEGIGGEIIQGQPGDELTIGAPRPEFNVYVEQLADNREQYIRRRAVGYYRLQDRHVYRYRDELLTASKPPDHPYMLVLYALVPATYAPVESKFGVFYAYAKMEHDIWRRCYLDVPIPFASDLTIDDLEYIGEAEKLIDEVVDARFKELMSGIEW